MHVFDCGHAAKEGDFGMTGHFGCVVDRARLCPDCLGLERKDRVKMLEARIAALRADPAGPKKAEEETKEGS